MCSALKFTLRKDGKYFNLAEWRKSHPNLKVVTFFSQPPNTKAASPLGALMTPIPDPKLKITFAT